jgi:uncharacterized protein (TIRG00374 family)
MPAPDEAVVPDRHTRMPGGGWRLELLKLAVSGTLLWLILRRFSFQELKEQVQQTHGPALLVPFGIILASNVLGAAQWGWILRSTGLGPGFGRILRLYNIGLFFNNFLLGSLGGDVYKIYSLGRGSGDLGRVAGATLVDRLVGLSALCTLAVVAALSSLHSGALPLRLSLLVLAFSVGVIGAAGLLLHPRFGEPVVQWIRRLPLGSAGPRLERLLGHIREYRRRAQLLNGAFMLSLVIQSSRVLAHFTVALAMGWSLTAAELGKFFLVIPILGLLIALPISIGGWGVREWAGVALFAPMGHGGTEAVTLLALTAALTFVASLVGAVALFEPLWLRAVRSSAS